jgi:hypothetical protein
VNIWDGIEHQEYKLSMVAVGMVNVLGVAIKFYKIVKEIGFRMCRNENNY